MKNNKKIFDVTEFLNKLPNYLKLSIFGGIIYKIFVLLIMLFSIKSTFVRMINSLPFIESNHFNNPKVPLKINNNDNYNLRSNKLEKDIQVEHLFPLYYKTKENLQPTLWDKLVSKPSTIDSFKNRNKNTINPKFIWGPAGNSDIIEKAGSYIWRESLLNTLYKKNPHLEESDVGGQGELTSGLFFRKSLSRKENLINKKLKKILKKKENKNKLYYQTIIQTLKNYRNLGYKKSTLKKLKKYSYIINKPAFVKFPYRWNNLEFGLKGQINYNNFNSQINHLKFQNYVKNILQTNRSLKMEERIKKSTQKNKENLNKYKNPDILLNFKDFVTQKLLNEKIPHINKLKKLADRNPQARRQLESLTSREYTTFERFLFHPNLTMINKNVNLPDTGKFKSWINFYIYNENKKSFNTFNEIGYYPDEIKNDEIKDYERLILKNRFNRWQSHKSKIIAYNEKSKVIPREVIINTNIAKKLCYAVDINKLKRYLKEFKRKNNTRIPHAERSFLLQHQPNDIGDCGYEEQPTLKLKNKYSLENILIRVIKIIEKEKNRKKLNRAAEKEKIKQLLFSGKKLEIFKQDTNWVKNESFLNKVKNIKKLKKKVTFSKELLQPAKSQFSFYHKNKNNLSKFYNFMNKFQIQADQYYECHKPLYNNFIEMTHENYTKSYNKRWKKKRINIKPTPTQYDYNLFIKPSIFLNIPENIEVDPFIYKNYHSTIKNEITPLNQFQYTQSRYKKTRNKKVFSVQHIKWLRKQVNNLNNKKEFAYNDENTTANQLFDKILENNIEKGISTKLNKRKDKKRLSFNLTFKRFPKNISQKDINTFKKYYNQGYPHFTYEQEKAIKEGLGVILNHSQGKSWNYRKHDYINKFILSLGEIYRNKSLNSSEKFFWKFKKLSDIYKSKYVHSYNFDNIRTKQYKFLEKDYETKIINKKLLKNKVYNTTKLLNERIYKKNVYNDIIDEFNEIKSILNAEKAEFEDNKNTMYRKNIYFIHDAVTGRIFDIQLYPWKTYLIRNEFTLVAVLPKHEEVRNWNHTFRGKRYENMKDITPTTKKIYWRWLQLHKQIDMLQAERDKICSSFYYDYPRNVWDLYDAELKTNRSWKKVPVYDKFSNEILKLKKKKFGYGYKYYKNNFIGRLIRTQNYIKDKSFRNMLYNPAYDNSSFIGYDFFKRHLNDYKYANQVHSYTKKYIPEGKRDLNYTKYMWIIHRFVQDCFLFDTKGSFLFVIKSSFLYFVDRLNIIILKLLNNNYILNKWKESIRKSNTDWNFTYKSNIFWKKNKKQIYSNFKNINNLKFYVFNYTIKFVFSIITFLSFIYESLIENLSDFFLYNNCYINNFFNYITSWL